MAVAGHSHGCQGRSEMPDLYQKRYGPAYVVDIEARLARDFEEHRGRGLKVLKEAEMIDHLEDVHPYSKDATVPAECI